MTIMKAILKNILTWIGLSIMMMVLWITGIMIGNAIIPNELMNMQGESSGNEMLIMLLVFGLSGGIVHYFILNSTVGGWKLAGILFLIIFGVQYFMSQIETLWFNESVKFPLRGLAAFVLGGAIGTALFSVAATWLTGNFRKTSDAIVNLGSSFSQYSFKTILVLSVVVWPILYWLAGYTIAWQFEELRLFYSGSTEKESFLVMAQEYLGSPLYFFQIFRGFIWVAIGLLMIVSLKGSSFQKGITIGLMLSIIGCSGLLFDNPFMPYMVRMGHLLETSTSTFLWGFIIGWFLDNSYKQSEKSSLSFANS